MLAPRRQEVVLSEALGMYVHQFQNNHEKEILNLVWNIKEC